MGSTLMLWWLSVIGRRIAEIRSCLGLKTGSSCSFGRRRMDCSETFVQIHEHFMIIDSAYGYGL